MTFPQDVADHHKQNLTQKCHYMVGQFKGKNDELYNKYKERLATLKPEDSWDFFHEMLVEYQKLEVTPAKPKEAKKAPAKKEAKKAPAKKAAKKAPAKKAAKKAPAKKAAKKAPAKKAVKKAPAKKVAKKAPAKKAVKKAPAKKVAKKKKK